MTGRNAGKNSALGWAMTVALAAGLMAALTGCTSKEKVLPADKVPPQILTSDLVQSQVVVRPKRVVTFVVVDEDDVVEVMLDGQPQKITPSPTVMVVKAYVFKVGDTLIEIKATDAKGNTQAKNFLVRFDPQGKLQKQKK
ncbi:MAG: hypothetical protein OEV94_10465 [Deltaproteobacteria bacterium]|nr:hypothetical protein [Deltaproteobacteria bacterium]